MMRGSNRVRDNAELMRRKNTRAKRDEHPNVRSEIKVRCEMPEMRDEGSARAVGFSSEVLAVLSAHAGLAVDG